jgi:hypothetical protein
VPSAELTDISPSAASSPSMLSSARHRSKRCLCESSAIATHTNFKIVKKSLKSKRVEIGKGTFYLTRLITDRTGIIDQNLLSTKSRVKLYRKRDKQEQAVRGESLPTRSCLRVRLHLALPQPPRALHLKPRAAAKSHSCLCVLLCVSRCLCVSVCLMSHACLCVLLCVAVLCLCASASP